METWRLRLVPPQEKKNAYNNRAGAVTPAESEEDMSKTDFKDLFKKVGIRQYEIADYLGKKESNFSRDLRYLDADFERKILLAIRCILEERSDYKNLEFINDYISNMKDELIKDIKLKAESEIKAIKEM